MKVAHWGLAGLRLQEDLHQEINGLADEMVLNWLPFIDVSCDNLSGLSRSIVFCRRQWRILSRIDFLNYIYTFVFLLSYADG